MQCAQAIWSIRVPCPGGSGAGADDDWAALASSAVVGSGAFDWLVSGVFTTGTTGGEAGTLEMLLI
jgi:hypothetical protein